MQDKPQELVTCKFCNESFPLIFMYGHRTECNFENHPNYQSILQNNETQFQQIKEEIQNDSQNKQEINNHQFSQEQIVQNTYQQESHLQDFSKQQQIEIGSQKLKQEKNFLDLQTESILLKTTKKCEYCNEIFPKEQIDDHYSNCQIYLMIEQLQIEETQNQFNSNENFIDKKIMIGQQKETENFSTIIHEELQNDGKILQKIITRDPLTNQTYENIFLLDSNDGKQLQHISKQTIVPNDNQTFQQSFQSFINKDFIDLEELERNNQQKRLNQKNRIQNMGKIKFCDSNQLEQEFRQCGICFMSYLKGEELVLLPCIHRFHNKCISQWLMDQSTCPICKINVEQSKP